MFYEVDELVELYGDERPPQTFAELAMLMDIPDFMDDPKRPGAVILDREWLVDNMVVEWFPILGQRYVNRIIVVPLHRAMSEIDYAGEGSYIKPRQCGIFNPRRIGWDLSKPLSFHSPALAVDINWLENAYGKPGTIRKQPFIIKTMEKNGFYGGYRWKKPDGMHWQFGHPRIRLPKEAMS